MSDVTDDDRELGQRLAASIGEQRLPLTPFEESRLSRAHGRRERRVPGWGFGFAAAAVVVLAIAIAPILFRAPQVPPASSGDPSTTASPAPGKASYRVYFGRDMLPPVGATIDGEPATTPEGRIAARVNALLALPAATSIPGAWNATAGTPARVSSVRIDGDLAIVDFAVPSQGWRIVSSATVGPAVEQLVFTATEEPGIRRVQILENGGLATIDSAILREPRSREQALGYSSRGFSVEAERSLAAVGSPIPPFSLTHRWSVEDVGRALARVTLDTGLTGTEAPPFSIDVRANDELADPAMSKWVLTVHVPNARIAGEAATRVDRTPLRTIRARATADGVDYELGLDDLRPWRASMLFNPARIVIDIGGEPGSVRGWDAVYAPQQQADVGRSLRVVGAASHFEANVQLRVRDSSGAIVARSFATASQCCLPGGLYETTIEIPANVRGNVKLEVYEASPQDGSDLNVITVLLRIP